MEKGLIHAYYGDGKGKTTSAIGQGIRAIGQGLKVIMIQFLKNRESGEKIALSQLEPNFKVFRFEKNRYKVFYKLSNKEQKEVIMEVENALKFARKIYETKECDILILDEILTAVDHNIISEEKLKEFIVNKPDKLELILTGRQITDGIKNSVDYITLFTNIKHPSNNGIGERKGVEY